MKGMTADGMRCLAGAAWLLVWWISEILPMPLTSLMSIPIFALLGVFPAVKTFQALSAPSCMMVFGATIIIGLLKESNFILRYAYWCLNLPFIKGSVVRFLLVFTMSAGILSAVAPNIPLAILFVSIAVSIGRSCSLAPTNPMMRSLAVLSSVAPSVGGAGTPLGGAVNMVVIGLIVTVLSHETTFWEWTAVGMPLTVITLLAMFALCLLVFPLRGEASRLPMSDDFLRDSLKNLGPVTRYEHIAMGVMIVALILWCAGPQLAKLIGWQAGVKLLSAPFVAILMGLSTCLIPLRRDLESGKMIFSMNLDQTIKNISWNILLIGNDGNGYGYAQTVPDKITRIDVFAAAHHGCCPCKGRKGEHNSHVAGKSNGKTGCQRMKAIQTCQTCGNGQYQCSQCQIADNLRAKPGQQNHNKPYPCSGHIAQNGLNKSSHPFIHASLQKDIAEGYGSHTFLFCWLFGGSILG